MRRWKPERILLGTATVIVLYLVSVPLIYLIWETFIDEGSLSLDGFVGAYEAAGLGSLVTNSAFFAFGASALALLFGTTLAFLTARTDMPGRHLLAVLVILPVVLPGILNAVAWVFLLSPRTGAINSWLEVLPGDPVFDIFTLHGMILVEGLHLTPLVFLLLFAAFRSGDAAGEEAAMVSGAGIATIARRISIPSVMPAVAGAAVITAIRAIESFEVPAIIGIPAGEWVVTSRIWSALRTFPPRLDEAGALSLSLLAIVGLGAWFYGRLGARGADYQTLRGMRTQARQLPLGRWRWTSTTLVGLFAFVTVVLPVGILVWVSTQPFYRTPSMAGFGDMTLDNYRDAFEQPAAGRAVRNSLLLGVGAATAITVLTVLIAWLTVKRRSRGSWLLDTAATTPLVIPGLVLGLAILVVYLRSPIPIYGTLWILFIAYLTKYLPYGMRYASASFHQIGDELDEAAAISGASWWQTFRRIDLPLMLPGLAAGWLYVFVLSIRELSSSILLYSPGTEVFSVLIFNQWSEGSLTELSALGVLMLIASAAIGLLLWALWSRVRSLTPTV
ncbi:MAG: ABC transporter permease [Acidimicrobiales bacterium]